MYGVIYMWRVKPDRHAEHDRLVRETLDVERERCPEVLLNVTLGPAADGACAEVQIYADAASSDSFGERVKREDAELQRLWSLYGDLCEPDGWQTIRFEGMDFLAHSFIRSAAQVGHVETVLPLPHSPTPPLPHS